MNTRTNGSNEPKLVYKHRLRPAERRNLWISRVIIWIGIIIAMIPVVAVINASLSVGDAFYSGTFFPTKITFANYKSLFTDPDIPFMTWVKNSMIICTSVATLQLFMTATGAYAFSRMKFKGRKYGLLSLLLLQMFPQMMALSAIYGIMYRLDLIDKLWALILLLAGGSAFNIWLLKGFMDGLPRELDEAAMVDGASHWQIFWKIIMPLSRPMLVVIFLFCFIGIYSEFPISSVAIHGAENYTIALGLKEFITNKFSGHWTQFSAAAVLASLPIVIIFGSFQKFIQKGLVSGAVKG